MMLNLFTIFDPSSSVGGLPLGWLSLLVGVLMYLRSYWLSSNRFNSALKFILSSLIGEMKLLLKSNDFPIILLPVSIFIMVMFSNVGGLLPHVFTSTSHMSITLGLSLPVWLGLMFYGAVNNLEGLLAHLVPQGTPPALMSFMVIIESISNIIRPLTLAVRLSANMIAGHLLLALLSGSGSILDLTSLMFSGSGLTMLLVLETAVALIQSYVFATLVSLYLSEV